MAIVEMKKLSLIAVREDKDKLLRALQDMGALQVVAIDREDETPAPAPDAPAETGRSGYLTGAEPFHTPTQHTEDTLQRLRDFFQAMARFDTAKKPSFGRFPVLTTDKVADIDSRRDELMGHVATLEALDRRLGEHQAEQARLLAESEQWEAFRDFPGTEKDLAAADTVKRLGLVMTSRLDALADALKGQPVYLATMGANKEQTAIFAVCDRALAPVVDDALKAADFSAVSLADLPGTVAAHIDSLRARHKALDQDIVDTAQAREALAPHLPDIKALYELLSAENARQDAADCAYDTRHAFVLTGWVPQPSVDEVTKRIKKLSPSAAVTLTDPEEGEEPPVLLHNSRAATPFENIVEGFALPRPGAVDPTTVMAPFYACFFGMMVSDAGYGLLMAIAIPLFIKLAKIKSENAKLLWVLAIGGVSTLFWGFMFNTWFGFSPLHVYFDPINNALPVMAVCVGLGALHLVAALGVAAWQNIRRGDPLSAVYDQLSWLLFLVGLGLLAYPPLAGWGKSMAIVGAAVIVITAGREKSNNPFKRLISGFGALYGMTGWLADLLSYMRLFGMGLATGVIGMVINQLCGMLFAAGPIGYVFGIPVFVGMHLFNAGINILGAYVHACRLQYIEFFGKFYEDGGKPFKPLRRSPRFVAFESAQDEAQSAS